MIGDAMGEIGPNIRAPQLVDEKFAKFENARQEGGKIPFLALTAEGREQCGVLLPDHGGAGGRGDYDVIGFGVDPHKALRLVPGFGPVAAVGVHLATAGLALIEGDLDPQAAQQADHSAARLREKGVVETSDKQRSAHGGRSSWEGAAVSLTEYDQLWNYIY
jgi:hypothetical protein